MLPSINGVLSPLSNVTIQTRQHPALAQRKHLSPEPPTRKQYKSLKPNSFTFIDPPLDRSYAVSKVSHQRIRKSYDFDQLSLDQQYSDSKRRIIELELTVESLTGQVQEMREVNKKLLTEKLSFTAGESQTMFQQLLLTDLNRVVDKAKQENASLREQNEELRRRVEILVRDKKNLSMQVKRYKSLIADKATQPQESSYLETTLTSDAPTRHSPMLDRATSQFSQGLHTVGDKQDHSEAYGAKYVGYLQSLNKMIDSFRAIVLSGSLKSLCSVLGREVKKALNAEKCTVYIIHNDLHKIYAESFDDPKTIGKVRCGSNWLYIHTEPSGDYEEPLFPSVSSLIKGHRADEALMLSVLIHKVPYLGIQIQTPLERSKPEFTGSDEQKAKILCELAAVKLDALLNTYEVKEERRQIAQILHISSEILSCRNHQSISEKVTDLLPAYFQFAKASIAFYDSENSEFFVCVPEATGGLHFTDEVARFPCSLGLSGTLLKKGGILAVSDMKTQRKNFHPEMDNLSGVTDIRNMMLGCLAGGDNEPVGVLQLTNKLTGINEVDQDKLLDCFRLIGASVSCANTVNECISLVIQMKATVDLVVQVIEGPEVGKAEFEANVLFNHLSSVRTKLGNWTKSKKRQLAMMQN
jgi:hypothetical protein